MPSSWEDKQKKPSALYLMFSVSHNDVSLHPFPSVSYVRVHTFYFILIDVVLLLGELVVKRMKYTRGTRSAVLLVLSFAINAQELKLKTVDFFRFVAFVFLLFFVGRALKLTSCSIQVEDALLACTQGRFCFA